MTEKGRNRPNKESASVLVPLLRGPWASRLTPKQGEDK